MINENFAIKKEVKKEYPPIPENIYQAEVLDITYKLNEYQKDKKEEYIFNFQFTLLAGKDKDGSDLRGRNIWMNFVPTYLFIGNKGKNKLYKLIEAILGHELSPEEENTLSSETINGLIGKQVRIIVKNKTKNDKTYSNIENLLPIEQTLPPLTEEEKDKASVKTEKTETKGIDLADIPF